jgi:hypothetical protein
MDGRLLHSVGKISIGMVQWEQKLEDNPLFSRLPSSLSPWMGLRGKESAKGAHLYPRQQPYHRSRHRRKVTTIRSRQPICLPQTHNSLYGATCGALKMKCHSWRLIEIFVSKIFSDFWW